MKRLIAIFSVLSILFVFLPFSALATSSEQDMQLPFADLLMSDKPYDVVGFIFGCSVIVVFFCVLEWIVSIPFKMHEECKKIIILTNLITQLGLYALVVVYFLLFYFCGGFWIAIFPLMIVIVPILPYVVEFLIYRDKMLGFTTKQILLYTIFANTASMVLTLIGIINA